MRPPFIPLHTHSAHISLLRSFRRLQSLFRYPSTEVHLPLSFAHSALWTPLAYLFRWGSFHTRLFIMVVIAWPRPWALWNKSITPQLFWKEQCGLNLQSKPGQAGSAVNDLLVTLLLWKLPVTVTLVSICPGSQYSCYIWKPDKYNVSLFFSFLQSSDFHL